MFSQEATWLDQQKKCNIFRVRDDKVKKKRCKLKGNLNEPRGKRKGKTEVIQYK